MPPKHKADEHASRINYLFQAAQQVVQSAPMLSQHYGEIITLISEKTVAKLDYTMKRSMCKKCKAILVPGVNMSYRLRKRKHRKCNPTMVITCKCCNEVKSLPTQPGRKLKAELTTATIS
ncbi:ribonuclease P protein subunit rpr2 [Folsomia candida]|uniref:Ribonuclease P protein component 4 n=1 Tax=Folsomia candida TaxID=158441 RepID=A0A226EVT1_FOLCA|nr:ribonuclease P protein subunit rpr2 [Folsomia candida]XP_021963578.1 ribonuclease P protein subunit rpr2 [Folsomia candida]XP_035711244.1 ribonuclease P protein subunit rpr2 [Folsomia candida]OXA61277.1 Ribonuclease P protein component 4 [Folsomia candida]